MQAWWRHVQYRDLDDTTGLLDFECNNTTYDGHSGNDSIIRDFLDNLKHSP